MLSPQIWFFHQLNLEQRLPDGVMDILTEEGRLERWGHMARVDHDRDDDELLLILGGNVVVSDGTQGRELALKRGDVFGKTSFAGEVGAALAGQEARATALEETTLCAMPRETFRDKVRGHLGHLEASVGGLRRQTTLEVPVMPLLFTTPVSRLAKVLIHLIETRGRIDGDLGHFDAVLRPAKLVQLTGLDRTRVRLLLELFFQEGILEVAGRRVIVPSMERLRGLAMHR